MTPKKYFCIRTKNGITTILNAPTEDIDEANRIYAEESAKESGVELCETIYG